MSYRLDGQRQRLNNPIMANEISNKARIERENYFGFAYAQNPSKPDQTIHNSLPGLDTYGFRKPVGYTADGLSHEEQVKQSKFLKAEISPYVLLKDGNPYNDRYVFDLNINERPDIKLLNTIMKQRFLLDDSDNEKEMESKLEHNLEDENSSDYSEEETNYNEEDEESEYETSEENEDESNDDSISDDGLNPKKGGAGWLDYLLHSPSDQ